MSFQTLGFGPIMKAMKKPLRVVFVSYDESQALDLVGPLEIFARATRVLRDEGHTHPGYAITVVAPNARPITTSSGIRMLPNDTCDSFRGAVDTLVVTGGPGSRVAAEDARLVSFVKKTARRARRFGSVCTGAFVLAATGLLSGKRAATHWRSAREFAEKYPDIYVDHASIFVRDGNTFTSAGVTAGIDLALSLVEEDLGAEVALAVARNMVVYLKRPGDQAQYSAPLRLQAASSKEMRDLVMWASSHPANDLSVPSLAKRAGLSPRQLSRVFQNELGVSPARAIESVRIESAQRALLLSRGSLDEVAARAGFQSAEVMRRVFLRHLRITPSAYRLRFGRAKKLRAS